jgi:hypothetical protein
MSQTPPQSSNRVPLIVMLLMALGVPTAAGVAFAQKITQDPGPWLLLAILYEIVVIILGFIGKVWQRLEGRWVDRAADWIDTHLLSIFSGYKKRYLQHLIYQHRSFDVKGLSTQGVYTLELEQVFVELSLVSKPAHQTSADPVRNVPEELLTGRHLIWDYLKAEKMAQQHLAIIGAPGSGKTTLLKHITLALATGKRRHHGVDLPRKLPVLLFLRTVAEEVKADAQLTLVQAVRDSLAYSDGPAAPAGWLEAQLNRGHCLIMLDGLDEVADPKLRKTLADWVERQMVAHGKNRFIVTSRPFGYQSNPLTGVTVFEVCPFTRDQMERFVQNWYLANEVMSAQKDDGGVRLAAKQGAEDLLRRISGNAALSTLAVNPLLLTMIALVHRYRSSLPGRRVELYAEICEVFLGKRQQARGLELDMTPAQKQRVLQPLAYTMMCRQRHEIPLVEAVAVVQEPLARVNPQIAGADFLKAVEQISGLLLERENGMYSFAHSTFQDYLCAMHIHEQRLEDELKQHVADSWWHETLRLYAAQADASPILEACLIDEKLPIPALTLALECRAEAREIRPDLRARLDELLEQGVEDADPERRHIVAEALLARRLHSLIRIDDDTWADATLITHAEYQLFLDEKRNEGKYYQPDHWRSYQFPAGQGHAAVVGVRAADAEAFCLWLSEREPGEWTYRIPRVGETLSDIPGIAGYWQKLDETDEYRLALNDGMRSELQGRLGVVLDRALDRARAHTLDRALDLALDRARAHTLDRAFDLALDRARAHTLDRALDLARAGVHTSTLDIARALDRAPDHTRALDLARNRTLNRARALTGNRAPQPYTYSIDSALDVYFMLAILEARVKGEFPAYEGIRIVKERRKDVGAS